MFQALFQPIKIRGMELKNRVKFPATASCLDKDGYVTDEFIAYHVARTRGGCAMNTTEDCRVHEGTASSHNLCICNDSFIPPMKKLTDAVHAAGGKMCIQLDQGGIANFHIAPDKRVFIPSEYNFYGRMIPGVDVDMIEEVVRAYGEAAARAVKAGFDCIELHCGHGYALHGFLSPYMNKRTDKYGGDLNGRATFPLECIAEIRKNVPEDFPLIMRIVPFDDYVSGGNTIEDTVAFCKLAKKAGVDALDVSRGNCWGAGARYIVAPMDIERGFNVENAARIKAETGMTVIAAGRINDPQQAEDIISSGKADMVDMGRAQIVDPDFCNKAKAGQVEDITRCVGCLMGCMDRCHNPQYEHISCLWNPSVAQEEKYALKATQIPKRVMVIGGGVAGMECADTLQKRGHQVSLFEASDKMGGTYLLAGVAPRKGEIIDATAVRANQVRKSGVEINLNCTVDEKMIEENKPDAVIFATGGDPIFINIPGSDAPNVFGYEEILKDKVSLSGNVAVIGGGLVGVETAEYLAEKGCKVTIVEMTDKIGKDLGNIRKMCVLGALKQANVEMLTNAKASEIKDGQLLAEIDGGIKAIPAEYVVQAVGAMPRRQPALEAVCDKNNIPYYFVGNAKATGRAIDAIAEAAELARSI